eukprot:3323667-Lingulodinium_polyedra.AAC.1
MHSPPSTRREKKRSLINMAAPPLEAPSFLLRPWLPRASGPSTRCTSFLGCEQSGVVYETHQF